MVVSGVTQPAGEGSVIGLDGIRGLDGADVDAANLFCFLRMQSKPTAAGFCLTCELKKGQILNTNKVSEFEPRLQSHN